MIDLKPACNGMRSVLDAIDDDQLQQPTPCTQYTVADLIDHVDVGVRGFTALAHGDGAGVVADSQLVYQQPGWRDLLADRLGALAAAWDDPAAWERVGEVPGSDLPNDTWAKIAFTELVVHGWDLAVATGQPFDLPEPTLQACLDHVAGFLPNAPLPELWGPPLEVPDDAPLLDQILAITGRDPAQAPAG